MYFKTAYISQSGLHHAVVFCISEYSQPLLTACYRLGQCHYSLVKVNSTLQIHLELLKSFTYIVGFFLFYLDVFFWMCAMFWRFVRSLGGKALSYSLLLLFEYNVLYMWTLPLCDEENQSLHSDISTLWAFCPAFLLAWRKWYFSVTAIFPITLKPLDSWKIFFVHGKVGQ